MKNIHQFQNNYPFISCVRLLETEYVGIIINHDNNVISFYDISLIKTENQKKLFLEMGDTWWWESNRKIPINIFLKEEMKPFRDFIKTLNSKDVELIFGPMINLSEIAEKRVKRKSIQLIKNTKKNW